MNGRKSSQHRLWPSRRPLRPGAPFLTQAQDDVLVARIWPGIPTGFVPPDYEQPLVTDDYSPDQIDSIDRLTGALGSQPATGASLVESAGSI
jgi:hypothetical protein